MVLSTLCHRKKSEKSVQAFQRHQQVVHSLPDLMVCLFLLPVIATITNFLLDVGALVHALNGLVHFTHLPLDKLAAYIHGCFDGIGIHGLSCMTQIHLIA